MSRKYKFHDNGKLYFISFAVVNWIDVFIKEEYKNVVIESRKYGQEKDWNLWLVYNDQSCAFDNK